MLDDEWFDEMVLDDAMMMMMMIVVDMKQERKELEVDHSGFDRLLIVRSCED